jgi:hypothetical protein
MEGSVNILTYLHVTKISLEFAISELSVINLRISKNFNHRNYIYESFFELDSLKITIIGTFLFFIPDKRNMCPIVLMNFIQNYELIYS